MVEYQGPRRHAVCQIMMHERSNAVDQGLWRDLKAAGYRYVTIDLQGYRTGSLNEGLLLRPA